MKRMNENEADAPEGNTIGGWGGNQDQVPDLRI
jgi:hypothetical protein